MKKILLNSIFTVSLFLLSFSPALANSLWQIDSFDSLLEIQKDSSIIVTETIVADFTNSSSPRRGIIREIPLRYLTRYNQNLDLRYKLISVSDDQNLPRNYYQSFEGAYTIIKIGHPDQYVTGLQTYKIKYRLDRGINRFADYDEIYWNVTGNKWDTDIKSASTTIKLPAPNKISSSALCFTGYSGSSAQNCTVKIVDDSTYQIQTTEALSTYEGLTIVAKIDPDSLNFPSLPTFIIWFLLDNWGYLIPLLVLIFMYFQWYTKGRDPQATRSTIMPEYDVPDKLSPAEIGTLLDDRVDNPDLTSTIVDFAVRGYLTIEETEQKGFFGKTYKYNLSKNNSADLSGMKDFETTFYNNLFESGNHISLEDLKYKFYKVIPTIKAQIYNSLTSQKYYTASPDKIRDYYYGFGGTMLAILFLFLSFLAEINLSLYLGLILSSLIILLFARFMPAKTQKGADTKVRVLGLEEFIKTAERDRVKFYEKENLFEKILPFAIALGLGEKWAKTFEGTLKDSPSWFQSSTGMTHFNSVHFYNSLSSFSTNLTSSMHTAPRSSSSSGSSGFSSGGGFSGGGFGGGGGSSW